MLRAELLEPAARRDRGTLEAKYALKVTNHPLSTAQMIPPKQLFFFPMSARPQSVRRATRTRTGARTGFSAPWSRGAAASLPRCSPSPPRPCISSPTRYTHPLLSPDHLPARPNAAARAAAALTRSVRTLAQINAAEKLATWLWQVGPRRAPSPRALCRASRRASRRATCSCAAGLWPFRAPSGLIA
jgi:hypothetical protein